ncbi:type I-E CRISPR-associated protein Cas7/Cse4/CasC [Leucobacter viscericola]|uniref:Type I-E CRISPR-associated protein Cas7/Cse4/CasC n=1 Tax=Leucobacter viscericola TaxID=2714935 RepID=A0A6G7XGK3_9MICO|nr:type I-E CRISPR-associated protein Cas7/Cse4/CasC [Leucobacter viscericola]QIK63596.1 type I-E CRISPR-associated protein Cas7/Cse4/CasC [Leucobacter viscericola]
MNNLTLHFINTIPWSNLNRDDTGTPKRAVIGGTLRAMLSSQSIKRAVRTDYELRSGDQSLRSTNLAGIIANRACEINVELDPKKALKDSEKLISALVKKEKTARPAVDESESKEPGISSWLSAEEIETAAAAVAEDRLMVKAQGKEKLTEFVEPGKTGSLSIAAFGRMFALAPEANTHAAVAVSPAIAVHKTIIETDYFSTVDDDPKASHAGASYLGLASYTSGVFYRSITIDRAQLRRAWTGHDSENAREQLSLMVYSLVYGLPSGKKNVTAPYVQPLLVLSEEQAHRVAYDFETPVLAEADGGYGEQAVKTIAQQVEAARAFDAANFGRSAVAGTSAARLEIAAEQVDLDRLVANAVDWILA